MLAHTFLIATWVGPFTPVRQEVIGHDTLRGYVVPVFEQNWRLFAPDIRQREHSLEVRASVVDEAGEAQTTEWVDMVGLENQMVRANPSPPRMYLAARRVANRINAASGAMNTEQLQQAEANYISNPISDLWPALLEAGGESPAATSTLEAYLTFDEAATTLATSYGTNVWDGDVAHIQYRIASRALPAFDDRRDQRVEDVEPTYRTFGWRPAADIDAEAAQLFAPYVQMPPEQS